MTTLDTTLADLVKAAVADALSDVLEDLADRPVVCTKKETAELLHCSVSQVEKWMQAGLLPRMPHTAKVLIPRVAIEAFATGQVAS